MKNKQINKNKLCKDIKSDSFKRISDKKITWFVLFFLLILFVIILFLPQERMFGYDIINSIGADDKLNDIPLTHAEYIEMSNENNEVKIYKAGIYVISGKCDDGYIYVEAKKAIVKIVLDNLELKSSSSGCIIIDDSKKTFINCKEGTTSYLTDSSESYIYTNEKQEYYTANGCIYSRDDLTINGKGSLVINGNYQDGIVCNDDFIIYNSHVSILANNHGINVNDSFTTDQAKLDIVSGGDGIHSINNDVSYSNYTSIFGGQIDIISGGDGIDSSGVMGIENGYINIISGETDKKPTSYKGISSMSNVIINNSSLMISTTDKGIKADQDIVISGGNIIIDATTCLKADNIVEINNGDVTLNSFSDGINSTNKVNINGGTIVLSVLDDGVHADKQIQINGGFIEIIKSTEGLESPEIEINGGELRSTSSDDGININCVPHDMMGGFGNINMNQVLSGKLVVNDGYLWVNSYGDGIDSNDEVIINGGTVIICGPVNDSNGALDFDTSCEINGGLIIICGTNGMATPPSKTKSNVIQIGFEYQINQGDTILITDEDDNVIFGFTNIKSYENIIISSNELIKNSTYKIYTGAKVETQAIDGYFKECNVLDLGTLYQTLTLKDSITRVGVTSEMDPGNMPGPGNMPRPGGFN